MDYTRIGKAFIAFGQTLIGEGITIERPVQEAVPVPAPKVEVKATPKAESALQAEPTPQAKPTPKVEAQPEVRLTPKVEIPEPKKEVIPESKKEDLRAIAGRRQLKVRPPEPTPEPEVEEEEEESEPAAAMLEPPKRGGRPKGSKNRPKTKDEPAVKNLVKPSKADKKDETLEAPIDLYLAKIEGRAALKELINQFGLPVAVIHRNEDALREGIKNCFLEGKFNPFEDSEDEVNGDVDENALDANTEDIELAEEGGGSVAELAKDLEEYMTDDPDGVAGGWKKQQKCDLICSKCQAELIGRCGAHFFELGENKG
ncbi:MAG: hypothetical protein UY48_C0005G0052 [Candidatus Gottesmanbacteria bacterium GW2011_GWB1_49_7]|uniref:Uncharacterized protein n=1 Tax=Candidatus Gottesmanbacteria bacterium GW2011_GWB1_49_7 TaxID=1618448 RepID=A0A0G1W2Y4_9BACT|nr:MAG: hypothetical protein UY48_C0005G0052 [Candidatus Gottesmanbacteria bacterium GW2011_GWB1_49_7]